MDQYLEFTANHTLLVSGLLLSFFLVLFTELKRKAQRLTHLEPQEAVGLINAEAVVIDLRSPEAYARGHIVNARNLPYEKLAGDMSKLGDIADKAMIAVCDAGMQSSKVVDQLRKAGNDKVFGLKGGMNAWEQASLPVVSGRKPGKGKKGK